MNHLRDLFGTFIFESFVFEPSQRLQRFLGVHVGTLMFQSIAFEPSQCPRRVLGAHVWTLICQTFLSDTNDSFDHRELLQCTLPALVSVRGKKSSLQLKHIMVCKETFFKTVLISMPPWRLVLCTSVSNNFHTNTQQPSRKCYQ